MAYGYAARDPWWDLVLSGKLCRIDLKDTGFITSVALRQMAYREAAIRSVRIRTKQVDFSTLFLKAFGNDRVGVWRPDIPALLKADEPFIVAPSRGWQSRRKGPCDCGLADGHGHTSVCNIWGEPLPLATKAQADARHLERELDELGEAMARDCTCGHFPKCLPSCFNAGGSARSATESGDQDKPVQSEEERGKQILARQREQLQQAALEQRAREQAWALKKAQELPALVPTLRAGDPSINGSDRAGQDLTHDHETEEPELAPIPRSQRLTQEQLKQMFPNVKLP